MTGKEELLRIIREELADGAAARRSGNEGKTRVCARRAAGTALKWWHAEKGGDVRGADVMHHLRKLSHDRTVPPQIRDAAERLTAKVSPDFSAPGDPLADSRSIITYLLDSF